MAYGPNVNQFRGYYTFHQLKSMLVGRCATLQCWERLKYALASLGLPVYT